MTALMVIAWNIHPRALTQHPFPRPDPAEVVMAKCRCAGDRLSVNQQQKRGETRRQALAFNSPGALRVEALVDSFGCWLFIHGAQSSSILI